jgi:hypothetical protein
VIPTFFLTLAMAVSPGSAGEEQFSEVNIVKPFDVYLLSNPLLMEVAGAKIIRLANGNQVILGVASTVLEDRSSTDSCAEN